MTDPVAFFREAIPTEWFTGPVDVTSTRDEILVTGCLASEVAPRVSRAQPPIDPHRDQAEARFLRRSRGRSVQ